MANPPRRLALAALPTPLERFDRWSGMWGGPTIWVKRDDLTGFGLSGNKVRKLEYHLASAVDAGADTVVTCGAAQSNHCRATALACARLGLRAVLLLRTPDGRPPDRMVGNHLLDLLAGAEVRYVTPEEYAGRVEMMAATADAQAASGHVPWVIPEGASDALGMWGFVTAMTELAEQMSALANPVGIWHAASSGGTTAGLGWGSDRIGSGVPVIGSSVGDTVPELTDRIDTIWAEALTVHGGDWPTPTLELTDDHVGLGYGLTTPDELRTQMEVTAATGLIFDPTYTGKAVHGLRKEIDAGRFGPGDDVVFWHTGGGFAVFAR